MVSVTGTEVGDSPKKDIVGLESEEVPGRGVDCEEPRGPRRLGVFGGDWASGIATPAESSGEKSRENEFLISQT